MDEHLQLPIYFVLGNHDFYFGGIGEVRRQNLGPMGAPGCSLLVEPRMLLSSVTDLRGQARIPMPIPAVPALLGQALFGQWAILDPGANALGLTVSDGAAAKTGR